MWLSAYAPPAPVPQLPKGLVELMEGLSKDVLKNNPSEDELLQFCADHMKNLLNLRGASEGKKPLSLEQKIIKAQEKIRKKVVLRMKKYDEQLKLRSKRSSEGTKINIETPKYEASDKAEEQTEERNCEDVSAILAKLPEEKIDKSCEDISLIEKADQPDNEDSGEKETVQLIENDSEKETVVMTESLDKSDTDKGVHDEQVKEEIKPVVNTDLENLKDTESAELVVEQPNEIENANDSLISNEIAVDKNNTETNNKEQEIIEVQVVEIHSRNGVYINDDTIVVDAQHIEAHSEADKVEIEENSDVTIVDNDILPESNSTTDEAEVTADINLVPSETTDDGEASDNVKEDESLLVVESPKVEDSTIVAEIAETSTLEPAETQPEKNVIDSDDLDTALVEAGENVHTSNSQIEVDSEVENGINGNNEGSMNDKSVEEHIESSKAYDTVLDSGKTDATETETAFFSKSPEIIDEDCLKDNEVCIIAKSNSTEQETGLVHDAGEDQNLKIATEDDVAADKFVSDFATSENIDIDINAIARCDSINEDIQDRHKNMDLETAAVTIQKVFRTFMFKSRASTLDETANEAGSMDMPFPGDEMLPNDAINILKTEEEYHNSNLKDRRPLGITRMDTVLQTVNEEKSMSLSDDSSLSSAATIIQAHVRGFLVRNRLHSLKAASLGSVVNTDRRSTSLDVNNERNKNKTVLNIHIVPEGGHYLSRDESMAMSLDLPYDSEPPHWGPSSSLNLHPLSERRKQLKREDAIQSISPPSNNSGKLSEDVESVKDMSGNGAEASAQNLETPATLVNDAENTMKEGENVDTTKEDENIDNSAKTDDDKSSKPDDNIDESSKQDDNIDSATNEPSSGATTPTASVTGETVVEVLKDGEDIESVDDKPDEIAENNVDVMKANEEDEMDVITKEDSHNGSIADSDSTSRLVNSGEFHDLVLPTPVSRGDATVARGE
ncbi:nuclear-pore anchor isoform X2 [Plutella xylostella]|uniref:nuclear-pore anchor isoform X2 n=1 Tax=Plutella xylostella TaxID=51655 RepID=UPI002032269A|nr:nuclear-pore anchor isoform X2 [Plutella xylostella]